ncbi:MAG: riboflavin synthase [Chthoniobacterales bacterium]|nr:riboflavin synthase [Chthoniobacterales bacterium]
MFTGLVEEIGIVLGIHATDRGTQLQLRSPEVAQHAEKGDSIAVNGCCLTVTTARRDELTFDLLEETLNRTNLHALRPDSTVNLERALAPDGRIGGHFVQGHIDCTARVVSFDEVVDHRLEMELPGEFAQYVAYKGSIALNGISLTVAEVRPETFVVWIIPHTRQHTNLQSVRAGHSLNVEFDLLAKYVERMLARPTR